MLPERVRRSMTMLQAGLSGTTDSVWMQTELYGPVAGSRHGPPDPALDTIDRLPT